MFVYFLHILWAIFLPLFILSGLGVLSYPLSELEIVNTNDSGVRENSISILPFSWVSVSSTALSIDVNYGK